MRHLELSSFVKPFSVTTAIRPPPPDPSNQICSSVANLSINTAVSAAKIPKSEDQAMDSSVSKALPSAATGISIRNGPIESDSMDIDQSNGTTKRKSRASLSKEISYKDDSDSEDAAPLVRKIYQFCIFDHWHMSSSPVLTRPSGQAIQGCSQGGD